MNILNSMWTLLKDELNYVYSAVSGAFSVILSEVPDDEIAIMKHAMALAAQSLKDGRTVEETWTATLNFVAGSELKELSTVGEHLMLAFIHAVAPKAEIIAPA